MAKKKPLEAKVSELVRAPQSYLEPAAKTNSCDVIIPVKGVSRIRGTFGYKGRMHVCVGSGSQHRKVTHVRAYGVVPRAQYRGTPRAYGDLLGYGYEGILVMYRGAEWVLTGRVDFDADETAPAPSSTIVEAGEGKSIMEMW